MNPTINAPASRRQFLKHMCKASLLPHAIKASVAGTGMAWAGSVFAADPVQRFVALHITNGAPTEDFMVESINAPLPFGATPYTDFRNAMIFCNGLEMVNSGHGNTHKGLSAGGPSTIDMLFAEMVGGQSPFSSIQLGIESTSGCSRYQKSNLPHEKNPVTAFNRLFGGGGSSLTDIGTQRQLGLLDQNLLMLNEFRRKLGSFQQERFDSHVAAIEKVEKRIKSASEQNADASCQTPAWNGATESGIPSDIRKHAELHMEIIALALKCGLTRTASLSFSGAQAGIQVPEIAEGITLHNSCHGGEKGKALNKVYRRWFSEQHAYLMSELRRHKDSDGSSILDNTVGLLVSDMGDGRSHAGANAPFAFFGGGAGRLRTGQVIKGGNSQDFIETAAAACGVANQPNYTGFGGNALSSALT